MISTAGLHWWMSKCRLRMRRSVGVFIHSEEAFRFSLESVTMTTDQGLHLKPSRVAGVAAPGYLLHYCLLHYWIIIGVIYELNTQTCFSTIWADHLQGLQRSWIQRICRRPSFKHDKSINKLVTQNREQQAKPSGLPGTSGFLRNATYNVNLNLICQLNSTNFRIPYTGALVNSNH